MTGLPGGRGVKDEGAWQSVLRPVDAATMPAAAAAAAAASTEQHRIRVIRRDSGCRGEVKWKGGGSSRDALDRPGGG